LTCDNSRARGATPVASEAATTHGDTRPPIERSNYAVPKGFIVSDESDLLAEAEAIERHLRVIRRLMRASLRADLRQAPLTRPQMHALEALVRDGEMSLKALSRYLALAHSTVSGIVDRLEQRGLVHRKPDPADRRGVRLSVTPPVQEYIDSVLPEHRLEPLLEALHDASPEERSCVLEGVTTLHRLLEAQTHETESSRTDRRRAMRGD
jgi:MarR family transcriptional regulator, organic hydroperoxide resistance regulator